MRRLVQWWAVRARLWRWAAVATGMSALWWSSSRRLDLLGVGMAQSLVHNSAHVFAYGLLGLLARLALDGPSPSARGAAMAWWLTSAYGVVDEVHQSFVPGRVCSFADGLADAAGAALGIVLVGRSVAGRRLCCPAVGLAAVAALLAVAVATITPW